MLDPQPDNPHAARSPEQQQSTREQLEQDIAAYLEKGGAITQCDTDINSDRVYSRSQRDSRRARDRMRLRRINAALVKEYREKLKTAPGHLLSKEAFCELMGISESCVQQWKGSHPVNKEDIPRPVTEHPEQWDLRGVIDWYERLKEKSRVE